MRVRLTSWLLLFGSVVTAGGLLQVLHLASADGVLHRCGVSDTTGPGHEGPGHNERGEGDLPTPHHDSNSCAVCHQIALVRTALEVSGPMVLTLDWSVVPGDVAEPVVFFAPGVVGPRTTRAPPLS